MAKKIFNFGERLALYEDLPANTQYNTMPEPSIENINNIIQYTGDTNQNYTNGYYYKCISDGQNPATYSWERINVQPNSELAPAYDATQTYNVGDNVIYNNTLYRCIQKITNPHDFNQIEWVAIDLANAVEAIIIPASILNLQPGMTSAQIIQCLGGQDNVDALLTAFKSGKPIFGTAMMPGQYENDYIQIPVSIKFTNTSVVYMLYLNAIVSGESWDMVLSFDDYDDTWSVVSVTQTPLNPQYNYLPTPGADNEGQIIQYTGTTTQNYTNGYFYICVSDGQNPATYSWEEIPVQAGDSETNIYMEDLVADGGVFNFSEKELGMYVFNNFSPFYTRDILLKKSPNTLFRIQNGAPLIMFYYKDVDEVGTPTANTEIATLLGVYINSSDPNYGGELSMYRISINTSGNFTFVKAGSEERFITQYAQTFSGVKTFGSFPVTPSSAPTTDYQVANKKYVDDLIAGIDITDREIVQQLPTQDISTKTIYMVPNSDPGTQNIYNEYMYINNAWELIGSTSIDLSNYYTKSEVDAMITNINNQIGNIADVLSHLTNPVIPIGTVLYTENVTRTVGNVTYEGTYTATLKEFHADTNYYVIDYTFENTGADDIPGAVFDEITVDPAGHLPLMAAYTIEAGETVTLTSYWQDSATYAATEARYQVPGNVSVEFDTTDNTTNYTSNLALNKLDGFNTDVVAHVHAYDSSEIDEGWTHTTFDRTGGTEDPYTVPEPFYVAWINFDTQTFGVLSEPISDTLTMTRSYIGFNADQFDQSNVAFFLAKTADVADCTWQEFEDAYYDYSGGVN